MSYSVVPIKFVIGSRKLMAVPRNLLSVSFRLDHLVGGTMPAFPPESDDADGYRVLSAPEDHLAHILASHPSHILGGFQAYRRYYIDMAGDFNGYLARFSSKTRSTFNRKRRKLAELSGGTLDLGGTKVTDAALEPLGKLAGLKSLDVSFTGITEKALAQFRADHPAVKVVR